MKDYVLVELEKESPTMLGAARIVKSSLLSQQDNTSEVFTHTNDSVIVCVHESYDAEDEITERLNDAGLTCFISKTDIVPSEDKLPIDYTEIEL